MIRANRRFVTVPLNMDQYEITNDSCLVILILNMHVHTRECTFKSLAATYKTTV